MSDTWHQHSLRVNYQATDQMRVVHHTNYISWFEISRTEMMRALGLNYREMEALGLLLPVVDLSVSYQQPARYDDHVAIFTKLTNLSPVRLEFAYDVRRLPEEDVSAQLQTFAATPFGEPLATGRTSHIWINQDWKITRLNRTDQAVYQKLIDYFA